MGRKIVGLYCTLCVVSFMLISVSCFNKWHQVTFKTGGVWTAMRLETTLTTVTVPGDAKLFCGFFRRHQPKRCGEIQEGRPLQEVAADWCAPLVAKFFPAPCVAFNRAYVLGITVLMIYGLNVVLLLSSAYLLYYYMDSKNHKPVYRTWAIILHGIGTLLMMGATASYSIFAMSALDSIGGGGIVGILEASQSVGVSAGYFLVWMGILLQLLAFALHFCMKLSNEQTEDQRLYKDMLKEQQQYGAMEDQSGSFQSGYQDGSGYGYPAAGSYAGGYAAAGYPGYGAAGYPANPAYGGAPPGAAPAADFGMPPPGQGAR
mmetsp:Transcript_29888/g.36638  ORF Transcript_29888/g.36638 Transcript_29888/m.36638 type:complete len:317 (+) Transcript_29888:65-1015(+)